MNNRNIMEEKWLSLKEAVTERGADGEAVVSAMKKLYSLYSTDLLAMGFFSNLGAISKINTLLKNNRV